MRKIKEGYSLLSYFDDTVTDFIEEKNDKQFIYAYLGFKDEKGNPQPEYFEVLLTENEYEKLKQNPLIYFNIDSDERGKAGLYEAFIAIADNHCTTDVKPIAPLTYILEEDKEILDITDHETQVKRLKEFLFHHIIKRGYAEIQDEFGFYFDYFE